ncbi:MAG: hypothetical protein EBU66_13960 [Bacteroidetes bacterium]|jgi:hypothetical protein|nr:hypothetical protein [Bacteroidota bacterium]
MESTGVSMTGTDTLSQVLSGIAIVVLVYISLSVSEFIYNSFMAMFKDRVELFPNTYASGAKMFTAIQNPQNPKAKTIYFSDNQRSGVEFSYSLFINIKSDTFSKGEHKLYHILHKGYGQVYPLLGPGIFCWGDTNKLRVYMNCFDTWDNYTDIENIPVDKWFHLTVTCKGNTLYVYINGNLKKKMALSNNTPPYQNYGNVYAFSPRRITLSKSITTSLEKDNEFSSAQSVSSLNFDGAAKGMISRVYYFSYALTYTEIQYLINMQPSTVMDSPDMSLTPYLSDTWWANKQGP